MQYAELGSKVDPVVTFGGVLVIYRHITCVSGSQKQYLSQPGANYLSHRYHTPGHLLVGNLHSTLA
jgi:hypothetical protein